MYAFNKKVFEREKTNRNSCVVHRQSTRPSSWMSWVGHFCEISAPEHHSFNLTNGPRCDWSNKTAIQKKVDLLEQQEADPSANFMDLLKKSNNEKNVVYLPVEAEKKLSYKLF